MPDYLAENNTYKVLNKLVGQIKENLTENLKPGIKRINLRS